MKLLLVILLCFLFTAVPTNAQTLLFNITTVVGGGSSIGEGSNATSAQLYNPSGIAISSIGEIYIADTNNIRIRKISTSGIISTIAGTGVVGYSGDGLNATRAQLYNPSGIAISSTDEIYISDTFNNRIRKISTSGIISTIAGNGVVGYSGDGLNATRAQIYNPRGIAISSTDEIYIADTNNHRIRKISTSGIISTIAGTGVAGYSGDGLNATSAQLNDPSGVAIGSSGEIYISDSSNNRIRKISTSGIISTIAGNGVGGYSGDGLNATIARLYIPSGVAISSSGEIYIADTLNHRIRKISTSGIISTIAGNGTAGYSGDGLLATSAQLRNPTRVSISPSDEIYIADTNNQVIRKISTSGFISTIAGTSSFGSNIIATKAYAEPTTPTIQNGILTFADKTGMVRQVDLTTMIITTIVKSANPTCARYYNNELYVLYSNYYLEKITSTIRIPIAGNGNIYGYSGDGSLAISAQLYNPYGIAISSSGEIYIVDTYNHRIRKISTSGIISTVAGTGVEGYSGDGSNATSAQLNYPSGIAIGSIGEIYIADTFNHRIRKISTSGLISTVAGNGIPGYSGEGSNATSAKLYNPRGISISSIDEIYISDTFNNRIRKISTSGIISTIAGNGIPGYSGEGSNATSAQLYNPYGTTISSIGEIYISDTFNNRIRKISTSGIISTVAGDGIPGYNGDGSLATIAQLYNPRGIAISSIGEIYISDFGNNRIRKISTSGIISTVAGTDVGGYSGDGSNATSAQLYNPSGIAIDSSGEMYISDLGNHRIRKITGTISTIAGGIGDYGMSSTAYIRARTFEFSSSSGEIYIADTYNHRIRKISTSGIISTIAGNGVGGYSGDGSNATSAQLNNPYGIAISSIGEIYISDFGNNRIRKISTSGIITTIAGNGTAGYSGDGSNATISLLNNPSGIAITSIGEIYIADFGNNRIRKISTSGIITTIAGNGTAGYSSDVLLATSAQLNGPSGVGISPNGEVYISDTNRVLKLDPWCSGDTIYDNGSCEYQCFEISNKNSSVCSGRGNCTSPNNCTCENGYYGPNCEIFNCTGLSKIDEKVCSSHGICISSNNCSCFDGYFGNNCNQFNCFGIHFMNDTVCSGRGDCTALNTCNCSEPNKFGGPSCEIPKCNGTLQGNSNVCSGRGNCINADTCQCSNSSAWGGTFCQYAKCFNILSNETSRVCNFGNGTCTAPDTCSCNSGWTGSRCDISICYSILSNSSSVCTNKRGSCVSPNNCVCDSKYSGSECEFTTCSGIRSDQTSSVCFGNGQCIDYNTCNCSTGYGPSNVCQYPICNGYLANDTRVCNNSKGICSKPNICRPLDPICFNKSQNNSMVCSGNGKCIDWDYCECNSGFNGNECQNWECFGKNYTNSNVCNDGNGTCASVNNCVCNNGWYGNECTVPMCSGILGNSSQVCNNRNGTCSKPGACQCNTGYTGSDCSIPICYGKLGTDSTVCSGRANCIGYNKCNCDTSKYSGSQCENFICFGIPSNDGSVCSGNGTCSGVNQCSCNYGYGSLNCDTFTCSNILATNSSVCSGKGSCYGIDKCNCNSGYFGSNCEITSCFGISKSNSSVCGGVGECSQLDTCICGNGYRGLMCELTYILSSQATLQFNNTNEYVGEIFTSMLTLSINNALFSQYYLRRSVKLVISFEINSQFSYSEILYIENGISSISLMVKSLNQIGTLKAHAQLIDNSTLISISDSIQSSNSISIQNRAITPTRSSSTTTTKPITSPQSSRATIDTGSDAGAIAAGIIVPVAVIGIGSAIIAVIVTVVVLLKKKAAEAAAKDIAQAQHVNVELL